MEGEGRRRRRMKIHYSVRRKNLNRRNKRNIQVTGFSVGWFLPIESQRHTQRKQTSALALSVEAAVATQQKNKIYKTFSSSKHHLLVVMCFAFLRPTISWKQKKNKHPPPPTRLYSRLEIRYKFPLALSFVRHMIASMYARIPFYKFGLLKERKEK